MPVRTKKVSLYKVKINFLNLFHYKMNSKTTCYEQNKKKLKEYTRNNCYSKIVKKNQKNIMKETKTGFKKMHRTVTKIFFKKCKNGNNSPKTRKILL